MAHMEGIKLASEREDDEDTPLGSPWHRKSSTKSFRHRIILHSLRNDKIGIRMIITFVYFCILLIGCLLYLGEALYYDYGGERTSFDPNETLSISEEILELVLLDDKPWFIWAPQLVVVPFCWLNVLLVLYSSSSCSRVAIRKALSIPLLINAIIGLLFFITVLYPPILKNLFIPSFFLCWPARQALATLMIRVVQRQASPNTVHAKAASIFIFLVCFIFTWVCLLHHFMRIDNRLTLFDTYWFVMVTVTTVGYGDISPSHWTTRLLVTLFIIIGIVRLIPQLEELYLAFKIQQRLNNSVGYTKIRKHIIICSTHIRRLVLMDFLTEFYSDPIHYDVHSVVLVEHELSSGLQLHLSHPVWQRRTTVLIGSPLRQSDLARARVQGAIACFLHTARNETDPYTADQHTIMSVWAIRNYLNADPDANQHDHHDRCKLYVQILQPENKILLDPKTADYVVCEGELKNALLAASSHCPGMATLVTLLLHTFKNKDLKESTLQDNHLQLYNKCAPCGVCDTHQLGKSEYFGHFVGKKFSDAAIAAYQKYHVVLLGVKHNGFIQLNPDHHKLEDDDICYYIESHQGKHTMVDRTPVVHRTFLDCCAKVAAAFDHAPVRIDGGTGGMGSHSGGDEVDFAPANETPKPEDNPHCAGFLDVREERHGDQEYESSLQNLNQIEEGRERLHYRQDTHDYQFPLYTSPEAHLEPPNLHNSIGSPGLVLEQDNTEEIEKLKALADEHCHREMGGAPEGVSPPPPNGSKPRQQYDKGPPPYFPYLGFEHYDCHLLPKVNKRSSSELKLDKPSSSDDTDGQEELERAVIVSCSEVWQDLYHFVTPLRACNLPADRLKPLVLLLEKEPSTDFLEFISRLPKVYYCVGSLLCINSWLRAGIMKADSVVVLSKPTIHKPDQHEHMVDAESIITVQKLAKLFPRLHIITEIHYRYNICYMTSTAHETYTMNNLSRHNLGYLFMPQFAAGRAFCSSMLDTLLYQAHTKPYLIDLLRQLLGCKQVLGSGFLQTVEMTEDLRMKLQTYGRLFQHLASTEQLVPLGIYRTVPVTSEINSAQDPENSLNFLYSRMNSLELKAETPHHNDHDTQWQSQQSFVLPNPPPKTELRASDIILVLKPGYLHSLSR